MRKSLTNVSKTWEREQGIFKGIIEVKSFTNVSEAKDAREQAAKYAEQTGLNAVTVALFTPVEDDSLFAELSWKGDINGLK
ncbi:MAG: hypothetical protein GY749_44665 [Desulfobacteraceae bacterium]|nr:hypothetical protein [Desulfobacteraceae bacterium]